MVFNRNYSLKLFVQNCFYPTVKRITHLTVTDSRRMYSSIGAHDFLRIAFIDRLFPILHIVFGVYVHLDGNCVHLEFFCFFQQSAVIEIEVFAVLPDGQLTLIVVAERILVGSGNVLEDHNFRSRF